MLLTRLRTKDLLCRHIFKEIWFGDKIKEVRRSIYEKECYCPLANASYTNMLMDVPTASRVATKVITPDSIKVRP